MKDIPVSTAALLAHDHDDLDETLVELDRAIEAENLAGSFEFLDLFWGRLAVHIRAENVVLFPALLKAVEQAENAAGKSAVVTAGEMRQLVAELRHDHDFFMFELTALIKQLRTLLRENRKEGLAEIRDRLVPVRQRLEAHNALEETRAYHYAALLLNPDGQAALHQSIQRELENLPPRLRKRGEEGS